MSDERTPRTDALIATHPSTASLNILAACYNELLDHARQLERELAEQERYIGCVWCGANVYEYKGPLKVADSDAKLIIEAAHKHDETCPKNPLAEKLATERAARVAAEADAAHVRQANENYRKENEIAVAARVAAEQDAERYRWLKNNIKSKRWRHVHEIFSGDRLSLDAAIDAAQVQK